VIGKLSWRRGFLLFLKGMATIFSLLGKMQCMARMDEMTVFRFKVPFVVLVMVVAMGMITIP